MSGSAISHPLMAGSSTKCWLFIMKGNSNLRPSRMPMLLLLHLSIEIKPFSHGNHSPIASPRHGQLGVVFPLSEQLHTVSQKIRTANIMFNALAISMLTYQPAANHDLKWYLSQVGTHVANEFLLAVASCGNVCQNVSAFESTNERGAISADDTTEEVGDCQYCNGVDVHDCLRKHNPKEWSRLPYGWYQARNSHDSEMIVDLGDSWMHHLHSSMGLSGYDQITDYGGDETVTAVLE
jgi:hypothetical protein